MLPLLILILVFLLIASGGGWYYGGYGPAPFGLVCAILLILLILWAAGVV